MAAEKAKAQALEKQKESLEGKHTDLNKIHTNLKVEHENLKTNCLSDDKEASDTTETSVRSFIIAMISSIMAIMKLRTEVTEDSSGTNTDTEDEVKSKTYDKAYSNLLTPIIEKIRSEYILSDDTGNEVKKCYATSIRHKESHTKCFEIRAHSVKSIESEPDNGTVEMQRINARKI